jgi:hypothetical protein
MLEWNRQILIHKLGQTRLAIAELIFNFRSELLGRFNDLLQGVIQVLQADVHLSVRHNEGQNSLIFTRVALSQGSYNIMQAEDCTGPWA